MFVFVSGVEWRAEWRADQSAGCRIDTNSCPDDGNPSSGLGNAARRLRSKSQLGLLGRDSNQNRGVFGSVVVVVEYLNVRWA